MLGFKAGPNFNVQAFKHICDASTFVRYWWLSVIVNLICSHEQLSFLWLSPKIDHFHLTNCDAYERQDD